MDQLVRLVRDGRDDLGMTVSGGVDGDAGGEVEEEVAVHVLDDRPAAPFAHQRVDTGVGRRHIERVAGQQFLGARPGQRGADVRHRGVVEEPLVRGRRLGRKELRHVDTSSENTKLHGIAFVITPLTD